MLKGAGLWPSNLAGPAQCQRPPPPTPERRPAWRAAALAYRQARRDGASHHAATDAAERSLRERWPELSAKEASTEVVAAIAYVSSHHPTWLWDGVVP